MQRAEGAETSTATDPTLGLAQSVQAVATTAAEVAAEVQRAEKSAPTGEWRTTVEEAAEAQHVEGAETPTATDPTLGLARAPLVQGRLFQQAMGQLLGQPAGLQTRLRAQQRRRRRQRTTPRGGLAAEKEAAAAPAGGPALGTQGRGRLRALEVGKNS
eukprot:tig00020531_g10021.t1